MAIPLASLPDSSITLSKGSQFGFETPSSEIAILNPETPNNLIVNDPHRYPLWRKSLIVFVTSWIALSSASSSTALFPAAPEIAAEFGTTVEVLNITNAGTFLAMGVSSLIWGPVSKIVGRRVAYNFAIFFLFSSSVGVALAPNFQTFIALRLFGGLQGTYFMVAGTTILADIFEPLHRGTAVGFFMSGTVIGPAFGPCIGGILVTFTNWRAIFWLQSAMTGLGFVLSILFVPSITSKAELFRQGKLDVAEAVGYFNPLRVLRLFVYPNIILTDIACGFLSWSQYSLLTAPRTLINPRFHLTTPLVSGLFYIAPGAGFLAGTICGGKFADMTVRKRIKIRGYRLPQDRLNSGLLAFAVVVPVASLIYGWGLQYTVGGLALPIISIFWAGFGLMAAFSSLNTYCSEVLPAKRTEVITGKYLVQYLFCAGSSASILPLINSIGVGLATTIGVVLSLAAGGLVMTTAKHGLDMQTWVEKRLKREAKE